MAPKKSSTALILETVIDLSKDMADVKARIFNGLGEKVEALWAWKEQYPGLCSFRLWLEQHPEMAPEVELVKQRKDEAKEKKRARMIRLLLLFKDFILAAAAAWGLGRGLHWW